ncbi:hypothetical protein HDU93_007766 [Gonapodya sp. JEL0774]|nr:hypothetical protein HDU93_007766 [Gonapodya sp. JEL0774]
MSGLWTTPLDELWFYGADCQGKLECDLVHALIWEPYGYWEEENADKIWPVAFLIHGGPQGAWSDSWSTRWNPQIFASAGYFVVAVNPTGSTGYGQHFTDGVSKHWGGAPFKDLMAGLDAVIDIWGAKVQEMQGMDGIRLVSVGKKGAGATEDARVRIDPGRVCALGASYGGYMINWINGHTDRFKCLVNHDGILNTVAAYYGTEELWFPEWEFGGPPWQHKARSLYEKWNPEHFVHNWKTPTLVVHSARDFRLPLTEGLGTFTALQRRGIESRLLFFPDENHWVLKPANGLVWHREVVGWLDQHLKG